jgi:predicted DNA-binding transcriptional regulator AlpA
MAQRQILTGMKEMCEYTGLSEDNLRFLIRNCKFPARKLKDDDGVWISNTSAIDEWSMGFSRSGVHVNQKDG